MAITGQQSQLHPPPAARLFSLASRFVILSLVTLLLSPPFAAHASPTAPGGTRHILLLSSYHAGFAWDDEIKQAVTDVLKPVENRLELHFEYMDTKRIADARYVGMLHDLYRHKYREARPDLIIASDNFAFDFLRSYRDELFPGVPVVFCGVNFYQDAMLKGLRLFTGVAEEFDAASTLDLILKLHPDTRELFVLNDHDITGNAWAASIREQITGRYPALKVTYADKLSEDEAVARVRSLPLTSAVLLGVFLRDDRGSYISAPRFARRVAGVSRVPIYGLLDLYMGYGIVGGQIIDGYHQGEVAARMAQRILAGEAADSIPVMKQGMTRTMFDYNQMERFGISASDLPPNSTIINKPHSFYGEHTLAIWSLVLFIVAESALIFVLIANRLARRKAQQDLRESQQQLQSVLDNSNALIYVKDIDGRYLLINSHFEELFKLRREETIGKTDFDIFSEERAQEFRANDLKVAETLTPLRVEEVVEQEDGPHTYISVKFPLLGPDGRVCAVGGISSDITERKQAETERQHLMDQLGQARKIESIGRLAGGIAHDFNNLLTPIIGYSELLKGSMAPGSRDMEKVNCILQAADKARILTQQLLSFGRKQMLEMRTVNLDEVITSFYEILRRTIREDIDIRLDLSGASYGIRADRNQLEQIIMNLVINAQDAVEERGDITIETALEDLDEEYARQHAEVQPGRYLMLVVSDSGSGMDRETLSRLFEPFFTTKVMGKGSGLGLATVYGLVKQHGGHIWVYSEIGAGTVFKVYFPLIDEQPPVVREPAAERVALDFAGRTVLLVEDNVMVRGLVRDLLISHDFRIIEAEGPRQAMELADGCQLDLLITDVVMPDMSGPELHHCLLAGHPGLKVLYMSGYTENTIIHHGVLDEGIHFIQKPFAVNDMARKIDTVLQGS